MEDVLHEMEDVPPMDLSDGAACQGGDRGVEDIVHTAQFHHAGEDMDGDEGKQGLCLLLMCFSD